MAVVAMTREMGSGGREIAQGVAERMGLTLIPVEMVVHDLADHMDVPESAVHDRLEGGAKLLDRLKISDKRLARHTEEQILELAEKGNVLIRGWGACVLLRGVPHVARIRVCAPMEFRERAVMRRRGLDDSGAARREIERNDAAHARVLRVGYGVDREDPRLYDLVLNTERVSFSACVNLVRELVESPEFHATEASRAILRNKALEARIRVKLRERFTAGTGVSDLAAMADRGKVSLSGTAIHATLAAEAAKLVSAIAGVKDVENRIVVVRGPRGL